MVTIVCSLSAFSRRWIARSLAAMTRFAAALGLVKDRLTTVTSRTTAIVTSLSNRLRLVTGFNLGIERLSVATAIQPRSIPQKTRRELPPDSGGNKTQTERCADTVHQIWRVRRVLRDCWPCLRPAQRPLASPSLAGLPCAHTPTVRPENAGQTKDHARHCGDHPGGRNGARRAQP